MKKHIFHVVSKFDIGGAEIVALNICKSKSNNIQYHLYEVFKTKSSYRNQYIEEAKNSGIIIHQALLSNRKISILLFPFIFIFHYLKFRPFAIHTHTEVPDMAVFLFYKIFRTKNKRIRTIHSTQLWNKWNKIGNKIEKYYRTHNYNIAISRSTKESYIKVFGNLEIPIIYNGVPETKQIQYHNIKNNKINILFAGRLSHEKGIDTLINIIESFKNNDILFFHIIGSGDKENEINEKLQKYNNVCIEKKLYNLSSYLGSFDYLLMPSLFEGLPLVSIEASLAKTPVIINNCLGLNETVPQNWPLKVEKNSIQEYKAILDNIKEYDRNELGNNSYNYVKKNFNITNMQSEYEKLYLSQNEK